MPCFFTGRREGFCDASDLEQQESEGKVPVPEFGGTVGVLGLDLDPARDPTGNVVGCSRRVRYG